jgi:CHAT domain-containing protein/tetratricopeptide (TPR) repeat protein
MAVTGIDALASEALLLAQRAPGECVAFCDEVLRARELPAEHEARVLWARGTARRELGDLAAARADLEQAWALAAGTDDELAVEIALSMSAVQLFLGDTTGAQATLAAIEPFATTGRLAARVPMQIALVSHRLGELDAAVDSYTTAVRLSRAAGDVDGEMRALSNLGLLRIYRDELGPAERALARASHLAPDGSIARAAIQHNLGLLAERRGDHLDSLRRYADAAAGYEASGSIGHVGHLESDRAELCLHLNLIADACGHADEAIRIAGATASGIDLAEATLVAARARLAAGDRPAARELADAAAVGFHQHGRPRWVPLARYVALVAEAGSGDSALAERAKDLANTLSANRWTYEALQAFVLAGRLYVEAGQLDDAREVLARTRAARRRGVAVDRVLAHEAVVRLETASGNDAAARRALAAGLRTVRDNVAVLGAVELRATMSGHAEALEQLGTRLALAGRRPRALLHTIDAARAMFVPARPSSSPDPELDTLLAELRSVAARERSSDDDAGSPAELRARRVDLEARIRARSRHAAAVSAGDPMSTRSAIEALGDRQLLAYTLLDGRYVAVSVDGGRSRLHELATTADVQRCLDEMTFAMHRLQRQQGSTASRAVAREALDAAAADLERAVVPHPVATSSRPLVIVPTAQLHGAFWRAMPGLVSRTIAVAPSLSSWALAAAAHERTTDVDVAVIGGPDLLHAELELAALATVHPRAVVVEPSAATVERVLTALAACSVAHLACHGSFRADNPLFSTLRLADGDLTVYDLERCARLPGTVVISACNAGQSAVLRGGALLGMTTALLQSGVRSVIAPLTPISDERSVALMARLHTRLSAGQPPADALAAASFLDGELDTTSVPVVCMGS